MKSQSYDSMGGRTGRVEVEDETYLIISKKLSEGIGNREDIDISYENHIIRIYSDRPWKVHPMNQNSQTCPVEVLEKS